MILGHNLLAIREGNATTAFHKYLTEKTSCLKHKLNSHTKSRLQSTLGFETLDIAAALDLETATPLTDPRQYINSNLGFSNLKI